MIREIIFSNYRSLGPGVHVRPGRLTFLVGPNGSGKSNILDVLSFVRDAVIQGLPAAITHRNGIDSVRRRSHGRPFDIHIDLDLVLPSGPARYAFVITGDRMEEYRIKSETAFIRDEEATHTFRREGRSPCGPGPPSRRP